MRDFESSRKQMVEEQLVRRGIRDQRILEAFLKVPRELFVPERLSYAAYEDGPLPIGYGQTISQPYVVADMLEHARISSQSRVLEIGTGSGYQTALICELAKWVYSLEIVPELLKSAKKVLSSLGYKNFTLYLKNGYNGLPEEAPFDAIVVSAAPPDIPQALVEQLAVGGRMVIPIGVDFQDLIVVEKTPTGIIRESLYPVRFVPMK